MDLPDSGVEPKSPHCRKILLLTEPPRKPRNTIRNNKTKVITRTYLLVVTQSCPTLCNPMTEAWQASLSFTVPQNLLTLMSIELVILSNHLVLCHPLLLPSIFASIKVFSSESAFPIRWPKYWSFNFSISLSNEYSRLISFWVD